MINLKILHWDEMFHPSFGYQINLLSKFQAKQGHEVIILTAENVESHPTFKSFGNNDDIEEKDKIFSETYNVKIIRLPIHTVISGRVIYKKGYIDKIISLKPDVIMCHTNDTLSAMTIAKKHKKINIPIVFDNHMLAMASKNPLSKLFRWYFRKSITPLIKKNKWTVIRTQDDDYVMKHLGVPKEQAPFLSFGSDTTLFYPDEEVKKRQRESLDIASDAFIVIYTGKLSSDKGGMLLAEAFREKISNSKEVVLVVVGNANDEYGEEVEKVFSESQNRILRFPTQSYTDLPKFYQMADLCVFPKQASLSFYDAQACGLPVVSEDNNVNVDRLKFNNGFNFVSNDAADFRRKIIQCVEMPFNQYEEMKNNSFSFVKKNYDYKDIAKQYTHLLELEVDKFEN